VGDKHRRLQCYKMDYYHERTYEDLDPYLKYVLLKDIMNANMLSRACSKVLDVGCGLGIYVNFLRKSGFDSYGMDISYYAARFSRQIRASATHLPFRDDCIDVVISAHLIEHLTKEETRNFLVDAHRVLRSSGKLFMITPNAWSIARLFYAEKWFADPTHITLFAPNVLKKALNRCGFTDITLRFRMPMLLQYKKKPKWIMPLGKLQMIFKKLPWLQDFLFFLITTTRLSYFRNVIFMSATAKK